MIIDVTGIILTPGNNGKDCLGNGENCDEYGNPIVCCCEECDYLICCTTTDLRCDERSDLLCPRNSNS